MVRLIRALGALLLGVALVSLPAPAAHAAAGDSVDPGCRDKQGCDQVLRTNRCTRGASFRIVPTTEVGTTFQLYADTSPGCSVRSTRRMISGSNYYNTALKQSNATSRIQANYHGQFDIRKFCFATYSVQRTNGTWFKAYHYNEKYLNNRSFRENCTED